MGAPQFRNIPPAAHTCGHGHVHMWPQPAAAAGEVSSPPSQPALRHHFLYGRAPAPQRPHLLAPADGLAVNYQLVRASVRAADAICARRVCGRARNLGEGRLEVAASEVGSLTNAGGSHALRMHGIVPPPILSSCTAASPLRDYSHFCSGDAGWQSKAQVSGCGCVCAPTQGGWGMRHNNRYCSTVSPPNAGGRGCPEAARSVRGLPHQPHQPLRPPSPCGSRVSGAPCIPPLGRWQAGAAAAPGGAVAALLLAPPGCGAARVSPAPLPCAFCCHAPCLHSQGGRQCIEKPKRWSRWELFAYGCRPPTDRWGSPAARWQTLAPLGPPAPP